MLTHALTHSRTHSQKHTYVYHAHKHTRTPTQAMALEADTGVVGVAACGVIVSLVGVLFFRERSVASLGQIPKYGLSGE